MGLALVVAGGLALAPLALLLPDRRWRGLLLALVPAGMFVYLLTLTGRTATGEAVEWSATWIPSLGIDLAFRADGLSLLFGLLITGVGALVLVYAEGYMAGKRRAGRWPRISWDGRAISSGSRSGRGRYWTTSGNDTTRE